MQKNSLDRGLAALRNIAFLKNGTVEVADVLGAFGNRELSDTEIAQIYDFMAAEKITLAEYEPHETESVSVSDLADEAWGGADSAADERIYEFYEADLAGIEPLGSKEDAQLAETLLGTDTAARRAAAERLTEGNLRWVVQIARDYAGAGVPLSDLIQEGNLALWSRIQAYDGSEIFEQSLEKGIREAMKALLREEGSYGRLEEQMTALANRILDTVKEMEEESGEAVSAAQISQKTGIPESRVEEVLRQSAKAMKNAEK